MSELINKSYKFRIYPTKEQEIFIIKHFGCTRFIYNYLLNVRSTSWKEHGKNISGFELKKMISPLKKQKDFVWLREVNSQSLQEASLELEQAFKRFFKKLGGYPKFKKKQGKQSFTIPQHFYVGEKESFIKIPKFKTPIKVKFHRKLNEVIKINRLTISKEPSGKYFVSINVYEKNKHKKFISNITKRTKTIGIDLGINNFLITSTGKKIENPKYYRKMEKKIKKAQRALSKKKKGSQNRIKAKKKFSILHEKVKNQRLDFLHKVSHEITNENQVIYIEDLNVKGMLKNSYLSKSIIDASWSEFVRQLKYKSNWKGSNVIQIGRFEPSSKLCSTPDCHYINKNLKLSQREWVCPICNTLHDRDINAAKNIEKIGRDTVEFKLVEKSTNVFSLLKIQVDSVKQESLFGNMLSKECHDLHMNNYISKIVHPSGKKNNIRGLHMKTSCVIIGTVVGNSFGIITMKIVKLSEEISILKVGQTIELPKRHKFEIGDTVGMTIENGRYRRILAMRCK